MTVRRTIAVTVPTYRRPRRLAALLTALAEQIASTPQVRTELIVVDNDPDRSGLPVVEAAGVCAYVSEPTRGLAAVRNRAIAAAHDAGAQALVFIDDDELPEDGWLAELTAPWLAGAADIVSGAVTTVFDPAPDPWIEAGGFFRRVRFADGERMRAAATNNLLIDLDVAERLGLRFDERFAATGGEDLFYTRQASARGARIVSAPRARVNDPVGPERLTRRWVLLRAYRVGTTTVVSDLLFADSTISRTVRRLRWLVLGALRVVAGAARAGWGVLARNVVHDARGQRLAARGAGMVAGAFGMAYREYDKRG